MDGAGTLYIRNDYLIDRTKGKSGYMKEIYLPHKVYGTVQVLNIMLEPLLS